MLCVLRVHHGGGLYTHTLVARPEAARSSACARQSAPRRHHMCIVALLCSWDATRRRRTSTTGRLAKPRNSNTHNTWHKHKHANSAPIDDAYRPPADASGHWAPSKGMLHSPPQSPASGRVRSCMSSFHLHRKVVLVDRLLWCGG